MSTANRPLRPADLLKVGLPLTVAGLIGMAWMLIAGGVQ